MALVMKNTGNYMKIIDETAQDIKDLILSDWINTDFNEISLSNAFTHWLHFKARCILPIRREVILSDEIHKKKSNYNDIIFELKQKIENGLCVKNYLSKRILDIANLSKITQETFDKNNKKPDLKDLLFCDWAISHFHTSLVSDENNSVNHRTNELLYVYIDDNKAFFLDILPHGHFSDTALIKILFRTYPQLAENCEQKGVKIEQDFSSDEVGKLRKHGYTNLIKINDKTYLPSGLGITTSCTATRIGMYKMKMDNIFMNVYKNFQNGLIKDSLLQPWRIGIKFNGIFFIMYCKERNIILADNSDDILY